MAEKLNAVKGMNDILPPESARWEWLEATVRDLMGRFAYRNVRTPILEHTALFVRGIGEVTDIVEKEMYSFQDRSDKYGDNDHLTLRPENTAGLVRAVIEHNMLYDGGKRLWYTGPMFRREKPQRGRFRQFHQIGAEALGFAGPSCWPTRCGRPLASPTFAWSSTAWGNPPSARCTAQSSLPTSRSTPTSSTKTASAACTAIRCAFSTPRNRR
jgi:hypothetical protein